MSARRSLVPALLLALGLAPATASAAGPYLQAEQINRQSGAQGAHITLPAYNDTFRSFVTNDGRFATFVVPKAVFAEDTPFNPTSGLYVRDIVDNTTRKIAGGFSYPVGLDLSEQKLSFVTDARLDLADRNNVRDLYVWNGATGRITLLSRATGPTGAAMGLGGAGVLSADGKQAVWGSESGVWRRDLASFRSVRISSGDFIARPDEYPRYGTPAPADQYLSDDGKVVSTTVGIVTPQRTIPTPIQDVEANSIRGTSVGPLIAPSGDLAVWQKDRVREPDGQQPPSLTSPLDVLELGSGRRHTFEPTAKVHALGWLSGLAGIARDGRSVLLRTYQDNGSSGRIPNLRAASWTPETDTVEKLGRTGGLSRNQRYAVVNTYDGVYEGPARFVVPTPGNTLPGGTPDAPSASLYAAVYRTCGWDWSTNTQTKGLVAGAPRWENVDEVDPIFPTAARVKLTVFSPAGQELGSKTWENDPPSEWVAAEELDWLDDQAFRVDITVTLRDGRVVTTSVPFAAEKGCDASQGR